MARPAQQRSTTMMDGYGMMAGMGWLGILTMALFWLGTIALVVWGLTNLFPVRRPRAEPDALEILRQRFARGEISTAEFEQARAALQ
jgi:putative membrane protein